MTERQCRICLAGVEDGELIQPCACQGSMRWVHASCLKLWWQHRTSASVELGEDWDGEDPMNQLHCDVCGEALALAGDR